MAVILILVLLVGPSWSSGAELQIRARYPDGTPAEGIPVREVQLERQRIYNRAIGATDSDGHLIVRFEARARKDCRGDVPRGYGLYRYLLMPESRPWQLSDICYWNTDDVAQHTGVFEYESYKRYIGLARGRKERSNWLVGGLVRLLQPEPVVWDIILEKGQDTKVSVLDQFGDPIGNARLEVFLDAEARTHTGYGGEIPIFKAHTNQDGTLTLPSTGQFYYSFKLHSASGRYCAPNLAYYSDVVRERFSGTTGQISYHRCLPKNIAFIVTDHDTGKPIANGSIYELVAFAASRQGGPIGHTDLRGSYISNEFYAEHVVEFGVRKEGYKPRSFSIDQFVPGKTYKVELQPEERQ